MAREMILVNLQRCTGCWSCALGCKMVNELPDDEFRIMVKTIGNGHGTDRPAGTWPKLAMEWQPTWSKKCTGCAEGKTDHGMFCVYTCPSNALTCEEAAEAEAARLEKAGFTIYELPAEENSRPAVKYARAAARTEPGTWERHEMIEAEAADDDEATGFTIDGSLIGDIWANPQGKEVLKKLIPWIDFDGEMGQMAFGMTLAGMAPFTEGLLTPELLVQLGERLAQVDASAKAEEPAPAKGEPAKEGAPVTGNTTFTRSSKMKDIMDNPEALAIFLKHAPWFDPEDKQMKMAGRLSLAQLAPMCKGALEENVIAEIEAEWATLAPADTQKPKKKGFFARLFGR